MATTGGNAAIGFATRLKDIGFPEFTTKLITDTFDALVASNLKQQQAYIELLQATSKSLSTFINDTKDVIGAEEIIRLFAAIVPPVDSTPKDSPTALEPGGGQLTAEQAEVLNQELAVVDGGTTFNNDVAKAGKYQSADYQKLVDPAAVRLAANKYTLLQEMVKLGMLRLVVTDGTIDTRLNFTAYGSDTMTRVANQTNRNNLSVSATAKTGDFMSKWLSVSASTNYSTVNVNTVDTTTTSSSTVDVNITGAVTIKFRTDYLPVAEA